MKTMLLVTAAFLLAAQAHAQDAELSLDTKRMLAYGTLAVMTGANKDEVCAALTPNFINSSLADAAAGR